MKKEFIESIKERAVSLPIVGVMWAFCIIGIVDTNIRGRFSKSFRERAIEDMMGSAVFSGIDYTNQPEMWLWSQKDRKDAEARIREALGWRGEINRAVDLRCDVIDYGSVEAAQEMRIRRN